MSRAAPQSHLRRGDYRGNCLKDRDRGFGEYWREMRHRSSLRFFQGRHLREDQGDHRRLPPVAPRPMGCPEPHRNRPAETVCPCLREQRVHSQCHEAASNSPLKKVHRSAVKWSFDPAPRWPSSGQKPRPRISETRLRSANSALAAPLGSYRT